MLKYLLAIILIGGFISDSFAQVLSPLNSYPIQQSSVGVSATRNARTKAEGDTLKLPFFDDFAGYTGKPSAKYWQTAGGVYVNNQFGLRPPSIHVATFEGLNEEGASYSELNDYGYTDVLTSKPILLSGLNAATDKILFSFYWQAGGLGGSPDNNSATKAVFLELEFKDKNENWQSVWRQNGQNQNTEFAQVTIPVTNPDYLHKGFQFRFRSSGLRRGTGDTWNLDYIYLNKNRDISNPYLPDVALSRPLTSLLERYTAMPANQFYAAPATELNDSAYTRLNNFNSQFTPIIWRGYVKVLSPAAPADTFLRGNAAISPQARQYLISGKPNATAIPVSAGPVLIRHSLFLNTREADARLRQNDTISRLTELSNFYAYDDGTAEANFSPLTSTGSRQVAYRFDVNVPDQVRGVRVYLSKTNTPGTVITFRIWDDANGVPASEPKAQRSFTLPAIETLNKFYDINFTSPVPVSDKFYVGFSLSANAPTFVNLGFDLNERATGRILYNNGGTGWQSYDAIESVVPGALMIRPLTGTVTGRNDEKTQILTGISVYPNPGPGLFSITGEYQSLCVMDLTGKLILCQTKTEIGEKLNVSHLPAGIYLLRFTQKAKSTVVKVVVTR